MTRVFLLCFCCCCCSALYGYLDDKEERCNIGLVVVAVFGVVVVVLVIYN